MKTKSSSRSAKKKAAPKTATVRARAAKVTSARAKVKKAAPPAPAAKPKKAASPAATADSAKYRQSGAPWWKQFI